MTQEILIVAGETSGDMHGAKVASAIKALNPNINIFGMGGSAMRAAGVETIFDSEEFGSVMGLDIGGKLPKILEAFNGLCSEAKSRKAKLAILIDYPDFNLRLAERMHTFNIKVLYYIAPQVWAWRTGRIKKLKKYVDTIIPILPFEEDFYKKNGIDAKYLGHPLLDNEILAFDKTAFLSSLGLTAEAPILGLLPGSRVHEIARLLPVMLDAFRIIKEKVPGVKAILPVATGLRRDFVENFTKGDPDIKVINQQSDAVFRASDAAIIASGTACLEAALIPLPMVVIYKMSPLAYLVGRILVGKKIKSVLLPNLIADDNIVPELLQGKANPVNIANSIIPFLISEKEHNEFKEKLKIVRERLTINDPRPSTSRVAEIALKMLDAAQK